MQKGQTWPTGGGNVAGRKGPAGSWHGVGSVKARRKTRDRAGSQFRQDQGQGPGKAKGDATLICWGPANHLLYKSPKAVIIKGHQPSSLETLYTILVETSPHIFIISI